MLRVSSTSFSCLSLSLSRVSYVYIKQQVRQQLGLSETTCNMLAKKILQLKRVLLLSKAGIHEVKLADTGILTKAAI